MLWKKLFAFACVGLNACDWLCCFGRRREEAENLRTQAAAQAQAADQAAAQVAARAENDLANQQNAEVLDLISSQNSPFLSFDLMGSCELRHETILFEDGGPANRPTIPNVDISQKQNGICIFNCEGVISVALKTNGLFRWINLDLKPMPHRDDSAQSVAQNYATNKGLELFDDRILYKLDPGLAFEGNTGAIIGPIERFEEEYINGEYTKFILGITPKLTDFEYDWEKQGICCAKKFQALTPERTYVFVSDTGKQALRLDENCRFVESQPAQDLSNDWKCAEIVDFDGLKKLPNLRGAEGEFVLHFERGYFLMKSSTGEYYSNIRQKMRLDLKSDSPFVLSFDVEETDQGKRISYDIICNKEIAKKQTENILQAWNAGGASAFKIDAKDVTELRRILNDFINGVKGLEVTDIPYSRSAADNFPNLGIILIKSGMNYLDLAQKKGQYFRWVDVDLNFVPKRRLSHISVHHDYVKKHGVSMDEKGKIVFPISDNFWAFLESNNIIGEFSLTINGGKIMIKDDKTLSLTDFEEGRDLLEKGEEIIQISVKRGKFSTHVDLKLKYTDKKVDFEPTITERLEEDSLCTITNPQGLSLVDLAAELNLLESKDGTLSSYAINYVITKFSIQHDSDTGKFYSNLGEDQEIPCGDTGYYVRFRLTNDTKKNIEWKKIGLTDAELRVSAQYAIAICNDQYQYITGDYDEPEAALSGLIKSGMREICLSKDGVTGLTSFADQIESLKKYFIFFSIGVSDEPKLILGERSNSGIYCYLIPDQDGALFRTDDITEAYNNSDVLCGQLPIQDKLYLEALQQCCEDAINGADAKIRSGFEAGKLALYNVELIGLSAGIEIDSYLFGGRPDVPSLTPDECSKGEGALIMVDSADQSHQLPYLPFLVKVHKGKFEYVTNYLGDEVQTALQSHCGMIDNFLKSGYYQIYGRVGFKLKPSYRDGILNLDYLLKTCGGHIYLPYPDHEIVEYKDSEVFPGQKPEQQEEEQTSTSRFLFAEGSTLLKQESVEKYLVLHEFPGVRTIGEIMITMFKKRAVSFTLLNTKDQVKSSVVDYLEGKENALLQPVNRAELIQPGNLVIVDMSNTGIYGSTQSPLPVLIMVDAEGNWNYVDTDLQVLKPHQIYMANESFMSDYIAKYSFTDSNGQEYGFTEKGMIYNTIGLRFIVVDADDKPVSLDTILPREEFEAANYDKPDLPEYEIEGGVLYSKDRSCVKMSDLKDICIVKKGKVLMRFTKCTKDSPDNRKVKVFFRQVPVRS